MTTLMNFLFPAPPRETQVSLFLFAMRLLFGILLISHGIQKWMNFEHLSTTFPDPIGIGSEYSLYLAIFGEVICSVAFIFGFLYRLAMIPMIITMAVAFFVIHGNDPFAQKELAFIYLLVFIFMYAIGPGRLSVDYMIWKKYVNIDLRKVRPLY